MKKLLTISTAALAVILMSLSTIAHHSITMFDRDKTVTVTGVVKEFQYTNPHSWLIVTVTDEDGKKVNWGFEAEGPSTLIRAGIKKKDFRPGTRITITGNPIRDGRKAAYWVKAVRLDDGKEFEPRQGFIPK
ncbi:MAG: hypothetical protein GKR93_14600 [Gammaproteobacteria bacterium]|nr:hypothetical protein [Gammaproteobacteria bacterium]